MTKNTELEKAFLLAYEYDAKLVVQKLLQNLPSDLLYHAYSHTLDCVYPESMKLAKSEGMNDDELLSVAIIALYHDTGFADQYPANEPFGAQKAKSYAENSNSYALNKAAQTIFDAILNTNMQTPPQNHFEKIIRDADLSVMGKPEFIDWNIKLRQEVLQHPESGMYPFAIDDKKWAASQLKFLESHQWFTKAATEQYGAQKKINIQLFKRAFAQTLGQNNSVG